MFSDVYTLKALSITKDKRFYLKCTRFQPISISLSGKSKRIGFGFQSQSKRCFQLFYYDFETHHHHLIFKSVIISAEFVVVTRVTIAKSLRRYFLFINEGRNVGNSHFAFLCENSTGFCWSQKINF